MKTYEDEIRLKNTRTCYGCKAFVMEQYTSNCLLGFKQERGQPKERCFKPLTNTAFIKIKYGQPGQKARVAVFCKRNGQS